MKEKRFLMMVFFDCEGWAVMGSFNTYKQAANKAGDYRDSGETWMIVEKKFDKKQWLKEEEASK